MEPGVVLIVVILVLVMVLGRAHSGPVPTEATDEPPVLPSEFAENAPDLFPRFWDRPRPVFDTMFGVLLPIVCLGIDPLVFRASGVLSDYRVFAYAVILLSIATLVSWKLFPRLAALHTGGMVVGAIFACVIGIFLLPYSLNGIPLMGLGLLGLIPFGTALVYASNAALAWEQARKSGSPYADLATAVAGAFVVLGFPLALYLEGGF